MAKTQKPRHNREKIGEDPALEELLKKGINVKIPSKIKPMLATLVDEPFDNSKWIMRKSGIDTALLAISTIAMSNFCRAIINPLSKNIILLQSN
ncbi:hypothetical protein [Flavobacterium limi]|uniref:Uncharacterized protein n=1 Tax=Flavobacterium limi TaxID=2045105 RepID=A0ABQ1UW09_9FLAO|nr:hypothetical protein [Flavobacterium limi]GGF28389.1 hypothetical protein GCM10011518_42150 [Flavobacterium limi]